MSEARLFHLNEAEGRPFEEDPARARQKGMKTQDPSPTRAPDASICIAIRLGLMWQAAFSVAMLAGYARHRSSTYLPDIAGAWPYVHQHVLWIAAFVALSLGFRRVAGVLAAGGTFLASAAVVSLAGGGHQSFAILAAIGVASVGVLPAIALIVRPGSRASLSRRLDLLSAGAIAAVILSVGDDGVRQLPNGGMSLAGGPHSSDVLQALWLLWVGCILVLAWHGRDHRSSRLAALATTMHLLVINLLWVAGDVAVLRDLAGVGGVRLGSVLRGVLLVTLLVALLFRGRTEKRGRFSLRPLST